MSDQISTTTFKLEDFFSPGMVKMIRQSDEFQKKIGGVNNTLDKSFKGINGKLSAFAQKNSQMISGITDQLPGLGGGLATLANPYAAAGAAVMALGGAYVKSGQMANEWQKSMALVNVTAQLAPPELNKLSDQILKVGKNAKKSDLMEVPEAFNTIISAGLSVNSSLKALEPTLDAAGAGFTDVKTTADAAVSVMNSSGITDATKVYDILFATMNKGKAEFKDIAQYLPKIVPASRNVGLSLEQTAGAYAYFTAQGQTAEKSANLLENTFKVLGDPDKVKKFKAIGVTLYDNKGKIMPLVSIAGQLHKKLDGLSDFSKSKVLSSLGLDMEAGAAFASLSQDVGKLDEITKFTTNSQGQLSEAVKNSATSGDVWNQVSNEGKAAMISIGQTALPMWQAMGQGVLDAINSVRNLYNESVLFRDIVSGLGTVMKWAWDASTYGIKLLWNYVKMLGASMEWLGQKIGLGKDGFSGLYNSSRPYLMWIYDILSKIGAIGYKIATLDFKGAINDFKNFKLPDLDALKRDTAREIAKSKNAGKEQGILDVTGGTQTKSKEINKVITGAGGKTSTPGSGGGTGSGRNVQVTINKLVEKLEIHVIQQGRESYRDIERTITEVLTKAVRDSEIALSTDLMARRLAYNTQNFDLQEQLKQFIAYRNNLTRIIGNEAVNFYKKSFTRQGFIDEGGVEKWAPRKQTGRRKNNRAIGVKTGRLRRSPRITSISPLLVKIGSDVPYAKAFNEGASIKVTARVRAHMRRGRKGGRHTVKFHSRKMNTVIPARPFMKRSLFFDRRIKMQVNYKMKQIFNAD